MSDPLTALSDSLDRAWSKAFECEERSEAAEARVKELEAKLAEAESRLASVTRWMLSQPASEQLDMLQDALGRDWEK